MINGVLAERTVKDVTPALQTNAEGLKKVLEELVKQYKKQEEDMEKWKVSRRLFICPVVLTGIHRFRLSLHVGGCIGNLLIRLHIAEKEQYPSCTAVIVYHATMTSLAS